MFAGYLVVMALWLAQTLLLIQLLSAPFTRERGEEQQQERTTFAWPYLAFGPALALELLLFQNVAHQTVVIGWSQPAVYALIVAANLLGVAVAVELARWKRSLPWPILALLGGLLVAMVAVDRSGPLAALTVVVGQTAIAIALASIVRVTRESSAGPSNDGASIWLGAGMLLMLALLFIYYAGYDTDVLVPREAVRPLAALLVGLAAVGAAMGRRTGGAPVTRAASLPALLLLMLPLLHIAAWKSVEPTPGGGFPIRVMSYNLHQGFDVHGRHGMESLAKVIEAEDPDIVALQEVSRGWVVNGSVDMLSWLSQRLDMDYVWGPASDPVWGNAVLSRFPITEFQNHEMPNNDVIRLDRSYLTANVDLGGGETLDVVATHFHAGDEDSLIRVPQARAVLDAIDSDRTMVLIGDLNAHPRSPGDAPDVRRGPPRHLRLLRSARERLHLSRRRPLETHRLHLVQPRPEGARPFQPGQPGIGPSGRGGHALPLASVGWVSVERAPRVVRQGDSRRPRQSYRWPHHPNARRQWSRGEGLVPLPGLEPGHTV